MTTVPISPPTPAAHFGLIDVKVDLQLCDEPRGATATARSGLFVNGTRGIRVSLASNHLLVTRSLSRADTLTIRFVVGLALVEFCAFWASTRDGAAVTRAFKRMAGIPLHERAWGTGLASRLASSEVMRALDNLPIFSRSPQAGPFDLFTLTIEARTPSDIQNWRVRADETESVRPIPESPPKAKPAMVAVVSAPDPFLSAFHTKAKELLSDEDYNMLVEMTKEEELAR